MTRRRLEVLGRLDRYVGGIFLSSYATALLIVVGLFLLMDLAGHLDDFLEPWPDGREESGLVVARYYVLTLPYLFLQVAPFVTLVAGMFVTQRLLKHHEIVAALGAGISAHRVLATVFLGGAIAGVAMFGIREWVSLRVGERRDALLDRLTEKREARVYRDLWVRDLYGSLVRMGEFWPDAELVRDFEAVLRKPDGETVYRAPEARWEAGAWQLVDGLRYEIGAETQELPAARFDEPGFSPRLALTYRRARDIPLELSFSEVEELLSRDPENVVYRTLWQYHWTFPLANLLLLLVGIPIMISYERGRGAERMVLGGLLAIFYFGADFVFRSLGLSGALSPLLAAWLPILFFGSLGIVLLDSMRT